ncbi:hypothetical protein HXV90_18460 [Lysinibacillus sp. JK80]|uniref:hypothetical protein n=1 Tax=Lysinibacillus sp. JK80 TaxID=2749809 RepID=UPI0022B9D0BB|nr:hypothetical protein [Lysinibacillus sp. JK80]WBF57661.1 hypothetical protein HXV90_18460 [Lysinibacillus sp. JK80]
MKTGHTSFFGGGHYSHGKQFIEKLPFREINFDDISEMNHHKEITLWVQEVISLTEKVEKGLMPKDKARAEKKVQQLKKKIENKIFTLYNLTEHEQKIY